MSQGTEIATETTGQDLAHQGGSITVEQRLSLLRESLTNPEVQPEKAIAMAELMFRLEDRDAKAAFIAAKVSAIASMPHIGRDGINDHTGNRYSTWEKMQPQITPILSRHGLSLNFKIGHEEGRVTVTPILSGHGYTEEGGAVVLPADGSGSKNNVQAVGSSIKYGQRYAAMAMLNIVSRGLAEDDDGNAGGGTGGDPYLQLTDDERKLVDDSLLQAKQGAGVYEDYFKSLTVQERGFLNYNKGENGVTWHNRNKAAAENA